MKFYRQTMSELRCAKFQIARFCLLTLALGGCATVPLANANVVLSDNQTVDLLTHSGRWLGRTITLRVYPYDNDHNGNQDDKGSEAASYVACLGPCDAAGADRNIVLIYARTNRFKGYRGDRAEIIKGVYRKICPEWWPLCLDAPYRAFALYEVN